MRVFRLLGVKGVQGAGCWVFMVFRVLGAGYSGCSGYWVLDVQGVQGAWCLEFRVLRVLGTGY